jgi:hypothetical protein
MQPTFNKSYSLEKEQELMVGSTSLHVHRTEVAKGDFCSPTLIVETSVSAAIVDTLFNDPARIRGAKIRCRYDGVEATAKLELITKQEFGPVQGQQILHFVCTDIEADEVPGEFYEFLVPHAYFGQGDYFSAVKTTGGGFAQTPDHIKLVLEGKEWILRHLIEINGSLYPADEAIRVQQDDGLSKFNLKASEHVALQVQYSSIERDKAEAVASDICWLLHLALAQRVSWSELRIRSGRDSKFLYRRAFTLPKKNSGFEPLRNWIDSVIKNYIEKAYYVFKEDPDWWRETLNLYSITCEHRSVESSGMILSVILDRLSSRILKNIVHPKQIGEDLAAVLSDKFRRELLCEKIQILMKEFEANWDLSRTKSLVAKITEWNNQPSYVKKIGIAFQQVGLRTPSRDLLDNRHLLAHEGSLNLPYQEAIDFYMDLNQQVLVLLFAMLGYRGTFFSLGRDDCAMTDFAMDKIPPPTSSPNPN